ncbi:hypothetical protein BC624_101233 [Flavobacterium granuli]|uniref:Uncharacterized protein n=1 Tax=Flavobacterium granuli TaxID=280093 RepID=A0A1M5IGT3_9FLAO|nr:hypothetical protein BC624_101233 [Flavobacterium granuli]SHG27160.1 hypothetical protein SAMN05443373_101233 [Flavobacterium granuli]
MNMLNNNCNPKKNGHAIAAFKKQKKRYRSNKSKKGLL